MGYVNGECDGTVTVPSLAPNLPNSTAPTESEARRPHLFSPSSRNSSLDNSVSFRVSLGGLLEGEPSASERQGCRGLKSTAGLLTGGCLLIIYYDSVPSIFGYLR